jgi:hypothetical protein
LQEIQDDYEVAFPQKLIEDSQDSSQFGTVLNDSARLQSDFIGKVLSFRTGSIAIVLDQVTNLSNRAGILRTAEAIGIQYVFLIHPQKFQARSRGIHGRVSRGSQRFLSLELCFNTKLYRRTSRRSVGDMDNRDSSCRCSAIGFHQR